MKNLLDKFASIWLHAVVGFVLGAATTGLLILATQSLLGLGITIALLITMWAKYRLDLKEEKNNDELDIKQA